ncbi:MAG: cytidine deaminase [Blastomonas sp.]
MSNPIDAEALLSQALGAAAHAYAPYSGFHVGAALLFADGTVVTGSNFENASYGLSVCAETSAILSANHQGHREGLVAVAVVGGPADENGAPRCGDDPVTPCGRCRQVLNEVAQLGQTDPLIFCGHSTGYAQHRLSALLPHAFGPANLT